MSGKADLWSKEETDLLKKNHGKMSCQQIAELINQKYRVGMRQRTKKQVKAKAFSLGLFTTKKEGYVTLSQAVFLTGVSREKLSHIFSSKTRKFRDFQAYSTGMGGRILISLDDLEKIKQMYPQVPPNHIPTSQANAMLGKYTRCFHDVCRRGVIPYVKTGHKIFIPKQIAELARANMLETGRLIVDWKKVVSEYNRLYKKAA